MTRAIQYHSWRGAVVLLASLVAVLPTSARSQSGSSLETATKPWLTCLVEKSRALAKSPDSAPVVAQAAMSLCVSLEVGVRPALERSVAESLVQRGVAKDEAEARSIVESTTDEGWESYRAGVRQQVAAIVVETRAKAAS